MRNIIEGLVHSKIRGVEFDRYPALGAMKAINFSDLGPMSDDIVRTAVDLRATIGQETDLTENGLLIGRNQVDVILGSDEHR
ncbi:hypothetical protein [Geothrix campi]|uniref:hypothetical protein n=1 Tax=Geothrix campi TaxID=2966450 RepID=UPI0021479A77|nr:hypothetical protein [Geothrix sp. SG10]